MKKTPRWMQSVLDQAAKPQPNLPWTRGADRAQSPAAMISDVSPRGLRMGTA